MTDISTIVAAARTVDIKHPATGNAIGLKITLLPDSDEKVKAAQRKCLNERMQRRGKVTAELLDAQAFAITVASASGWDWDGEATFHGEKPEFSEANLRKVLKELPWIKDQLLEERGDDAAFFPS